MPTIDPLTFPAQCGMFLPHFFGYPMAPRKYIEIAKLVSMKEIAASLGLSYASVYRFAHFSNFPAPVKVLYIGALYDADAVGKWYMWYKAQPERRGRPRGSSGKSPATKNEFLEAVVASRRHQPGE